MKLRILLLAALLMSAYPGAAHALSLGTLGAVGQTVYGTGTIYNVDGEYGPGSTYDVWDLELTSQLDVVIDVLAYGVDVFKTGTTTYLQPYISLFNSAGDLLAGTYYSVNWPAEGAADGSIDQIDPYLRLLLDPGSYLLAIGAYSLEYATVIGDFADPYNVGFYISDENGEFIDCGYGNYQIAVSAVPEPATLFLVGTGLAGLGFIRRRREQRTKAA